MSPSSGEFPRELQEQGYLFVPGLLEREEAETLRGQIQTLSGLSDASFRTEHFECPDGVSRNRQFWPLIVHPRLVRLIRGLLGETAGYTQHSDLHAHRTGGWHRDSACREFGKGSDWDESRVPYRVLRVAIYLQSYAESGAKLGVLPGSHRYEEPLSALEQRYWNFLRRRLPWRREPTASESEIAPPMIRTRRGLPFWTPPTTPVWIKTEPGDCVVFDQRLYHCSSSIHGPKYAVFLSYGLENEHSRHHLHYYLNVRKDLGYRPLDPALVEQLKSAGIYMAPPEQFESEQVENRKSTATATEEGRQ